MRSCWRWRADNENGCPRSGSQRRRRARRHDDPWRRGRSGNRRQYGRGVALGLTPGDLAISFGTSGTVFASSSTPTSDRQGEVAGFADAAGRFLRRVHVERDQGHRVGGRSHRRQGQRSRSDRSTRSPGANASYSSLPRRRTDAAVANGDGRLSGLRTSTTIADIVRASVEGVICGLLAGVDALERCDVDTNGRILAVGGGARSTLYAKCWPISRRVRS